MIILNWIIKVKHENLCAAKAVFENWMFIFTKYNSISSIAHQSIKQSVHKTILFALQCFLVVDPFECFVILPCSTWNKHVGNGYVGV